MTIEQQIAEMLRPQEVARCIKILDGLPVLFGQVLKTASSHCPVPEHNPHLFYDTETKEIWCPECVNAVLDILATEGLRKQQAKAK